MDLEKRGHARHARNEKDETTCTADHSERNRSLHTKTQSFLANAELPTDSHHSNLPACLEKTLQEKRPFPLNYAHVFFLLSTGLIAV